MSKQSFFRPIYMALAILLLATGAALAPGPAADVAPLEVLAPARAGSLAQAPTSTPAPLCTVVANFVNLRTGPGTSYNPPLAQLPQGARLNPQAFVAKGNPGGRWVQVQVQASGQTGWVAAEGQYISCNVNVANLPPGTAPAPPTVPPPPPVRRTLQPDGGKEDSGLEGQIVIPVSVEITSDQVAVFRNVLAFNAEVYNPSAGSRDGAGIQEVTITITDSNGNLVHQRTERTAAYCVFGGGEPDCNVWNFAEHDFRWPDGEELRTDKYNVSFDIVQEDGFNTGWIWSFLLLR